MPQFGSLEGVSAPIQSNMGTNFINSPMGRSLIAFLVMYIGLGMAPDMWPLEKMVAIKDEAGIVDKKKRAMVSAAGAALAFFASSYFKQ